MALFRTEAVEAASPSHFGEVLLTQPAKLTWLTLGAFFLFLVSLPLLIFGEFSRSETVLGYIAPSEGISQLFAPQAGTVSAAFVREGDRVAAGDVLFEISTELANGAGRGTLSAQLGNIDQRIQERRLQAELNLQRLRSEIERTRRRIYNADDDIERMMTQRVLIYERSLLSENEWQRWQEAGSRGALSDAEMESRKQDLLSARLEIQEFDREIAIRRDEADDLQHALNTMLIDVSLAESQARSDFASLSQLRSELEGAIGRQITAPVSGRITAIQATLGQATRLGMPIALIVPDNQELHALLYAPTRTVGFIEPSQTVRLRVDAFPYQRFGSLAGHVSEVSGTVLSPTEIISPVPVTESVYRLTVELTQQGINAYGNFEALQSGMTVQADLIIDRRPLWRWIVDPIMTYRKP